VGVDRAGYHEQWRKSSRVGEPSFNTLQKRCPTIAATGDQGRRGVVSMMEAAN